MSFTSIKLQAAIEYPLEDLEKSLVEARIILLINLLSNMYQAIL